MHYSILAIISASVVFQFIAALLALRLITVSGRMWAWILVATALTVMGIRRVVAMGHVISGSQQGDLSVELLGLVISLLMVAGIALIRPLFEELHHSRRELLERKRELELINHTLESRVAEEVQSNLEKDRLMILREREAAMGEMVASIAHQWKQPLNNLALLIQGVQYEFKSGELVEKEMDNVAGRCLEQIQHMSRTMDEFRSFFKPQPQSLPFSLAAEVTRALSLVSASFTRLGINTSLTVEEDTELVGSSNQCAQVLLTLFQNCQEAFVERAIAAPLVTVWVFRDHDRAVVTVLDNAGGIDAGVIDSLFSSHVTTKEKGSGIGLYLARTIVEKKFNGELSVSNSSGGAEFRIVI
jgi:C4-dicarboxylate-specific signal transduction histidine kinase